MRSWFGPSLAAAVLLAIPAASVAQDAEALLREGRFAEAVDRAGGTGPGEAARLAQAILDQALVQGYEAGNFDYAVRGLVAAKRLPGLERDLLQELDYWHAWSLYRLGEEVQRPGTPASAEAALPHFVEARRIVNGIDRNVYDVFDLDSSLEEYVQLLRGVARQG